MKKLTAVLLCLVCAYTGFCQHASLKGNVVDTFSNKKLTNTVIAVLHAKDSILYKFTRTDAAGKFEFNNLQAGKYLLLVSSPSYADFVDPFTLSDTTQFNYNNVILSLKARLLEAVVVRQTVSSIKLKGDTTEYAADSFKVQPNASVEDLLKKLPGIQVDKNGQITAQGQKVQKVLVDGEEFFGDDPTLVTQNLRADMVDKVQVFDKKSDQAAFTGIDDGQKAKTLNLKLKDNKKNGYFGKLNVGAGTNGYHDNQAMFNMFKKKQKISAYGIISNTGKTGLNWQERDSYGQSNTDNVSYDETSGYYFSMGQSDDLDTWNGQYNGQGFPLVQTGGLHYNNKWDDDKQSINGNYKILQLHVDGNSTTNSQNFLPDKSWYYTNSQQGFTNKILRNRANGSYEIQLDSTSSVKIMADGGTDHKITNTLNSSQTLAQDSTLMNENQRSLTTTGDMNTVNGNILWRKKLKKKGRTLSFNLIERYNKNNSTGFLNSLTKFYKNGGVDSVQRIDQYKTNASESVLFDTKLTYSEPLSPTSALVFNYGIVVNNSNSNRNSFNKNPDGKYSQLDTAYSNDYEFNMFTHRGGVSYSMTKKKFRMNVGGNVGLTNFDQKDMQRNIVQKRDFVNWYPQANFSYSFTNQRRLNFNYNGSTTQPRIDQIQPLRTNDDPLNIVIGNPNLKPQFGNSFWLNFSDYKVLTERGIWISTSYSFTQNAISNKSTIDNTGKRTTQAVNVDGIRSASVYLDYGFKLKKLDLRVGANGNLNMSRYVGYVNDVLNVTNSGNYTGGIYLGKYKEKKFDISLNASATYTNSKSSVQQTAENNYWSFNIRPDADVFLPLKFQVHTDCNFNLRQKTQAFYDNNNVILWNAWLGKKFLKNDALLIKAAVNDLLNQNIGFNRQVNSNFNSQTTYSTIRRYLMFSAVWNFTKAGVAAPAQR